MRWDFECVPDYGRGRGCGARGAGGEGRGRGDIGIGLEGLQLALVEVGHAVRVVVVVDQPDLEDRARVQKVAHDAPHEGDDRPHRQHVRGVLPAAPGPTRSRLH
jgi:hypothetical protein